MSENIGSRDVFDFFTMARELRDQIYDKILMCQPPIDLGTKPGPRIIVEHAMPVRLALVSRQFYKECKERMKHTLCLVLKDHEDFFDANEMQLPAITSQAAELEFHIENKYLYGGHSHVDDECGTMGEFQFHSEWITMVIKAQQQVRPISIDLYLRKQRTGVDHFDAVHDHRAILTGLQGLTMLKVHQFPRHMPLFDCQSRTVLKWSTEDGQLKRVGNAMYGLP